MKILFKLSLIELNKTYKRLIVLLVSLISIFISFNTLSTVAISIKDSFYNSYGNCSFTMETINYNFLNQIDEKFSVNIMIDGIQGLTEYYPNENVSQPFFEFNGNKSEVSYFKIKFNDSEKLYTYEEMVKKINDGELNVSNINTISYSGCFHNNNLNYNSIILSDIIANKLDCQNGDNIYFEFYGNKYIFNVSEIKSYGELNRSFIINYDFFKYNSLDNSIRCNVETILNDNADFNIVFEMFNNEINSFTYDKTFKRYFDLVNNLSYAFIIFSICFAFFSMLCCFIFIRSIVSFRNKELQKLRIIGASILDILKIYSPIFLSIIIFTLLLSNGISFILLERIRLLFYELFDFNLVYKNVYLLDIGLGFFSMIIMFLTTLLSIRTKDNYRKLR